MAEKIDIYLNNAMKTQNFLPERFIKLGRLFQRELLWI